GEHLLRHHRSSSSSGPGSGAFFASRSHQPIDLAIEPFLDDGGPSANAVAAELLLGLEMATGKEQFRVAAGEVGQALLPEAARGGAAAAGLLQIARRMPM